MVNYEQVAALLSYNPETGALTWLVQTSSRALVGDEAGCIERQGYCVIRIERKLYQAHRLAWLLTHRKWPDNEIDHINGERSDNRIANLRDVTHFENMQNRKSSPNKSKNPNRLRGTTQTPSGKWQAHIRLNGERRYLGLFDSAEDANAAYETAKTMHFEDRRVETTYGQ